MGEPGNGPVVLSAGTEEAGALGCEEVDEQARSVVAATALEADEAVLDNVDAADTVVVANLVEELEQVQAVGDLLLVLGNHLDGNTLLKVDGELVGLVRRIHGVKGAAGGRVSAGGESVSGWMGGSRPELLGRSVVGVLEDTSLVRAVNKVV